MSPEEKEAGYMALQLIAAIVFLGGVVGIMFKLLIASKDREHEATLKQLESELKEKEAIKVSLKSITDEAMAYAREVTNRLREKEGKPPVVYVPPVISESASPSTQLQRDAAHVSTQRAVMEVLQREAGNPPRQEPPEAQLEVEPAPVPKAK